jgi:hypothetical protein
VCGGTRFAIELVDGVSHEMFLVSLFASAAKVSGHWSSEAASPLAIAQQQGSAAPLSAYQCPVSHPIKGNFTTYKRRTVYFSFTGRAVL